MSTAQERFNAQCELNDAEGALELLERQAREARAKVEGLRAKVITLKEAEFREEQHRLASQPITDRDGYESAALYARDRRQAQRIVEPEPPIERGRRDRGAWE